jgi:hypothetical protein
VVANNGGLAHVYLQNRQAPEGSRHWRYAPRMAEDVLPVARAFWEASQTGRYAPDLKDAQAMVLVRSTEREGWDAHYQALTPDGQLIPPADFLRAHPEIVTVDAVPRLRALSGPNSGDLLLVSNYAQRFYFGGPTVGVHGGLHPDDSLAVGSFGWQGASAAQVDHLRSIAAGLVDDRKKAEGRSYADLADLLPVIVELFGWQAGASG